MRQIGDYEWEQLSMWDFSPSDCIEKFIPSDNGEHTFHYYLKRIVEIISPTHWRTEVVLIPDGVPQEVLTWRTPRYWVKNNNKSIEAKP